jgi:ubiquitin-protein ligase
MSAQQENSDLIFQRFLARQIEEGLALGQSSDLLDLHIPSTPPPHFVAEFHCMGLVREGEGEIREANEFHVGIWFPPDYLRRVDPFQILRMYTSHVWHPNVSREIPLICIGRLTPGTALVEILYQLFDILTYQKYNPREDDSLNKAACAWARANQDRFPVDRRPLKRQPLGLEVRAL